MKRRAILYIRVSTDEQADKGYSLLHQQERLEKYCELQNIEVIALFKEDFSAKTFLRPEFAKLLSFLKKNKNTVDLLLFTKWDRFSRNAGDAYSMINTLTKLCVEPQAIEQPLDLEIPENKIMLAFYLAAPEVENDRRALNVLVGMRRAKREGRWVVMAPKGYKNVRDENNRPIIIPSDDAKFMKEGFEEIAKGTLSIDEVRRMLNKKGFKCGRNNFWKLIHNPVYCGKIKIPAYKDEPEQMVKGMHEPIISEELFNEVQDIFSGRKKKFPPKYTRREELPLRGFLLCPRCGKPLTGSASQGNGGKYFYYHCHPKCGERMRADETNKGMVKELAKISSNRNVIDLYYETMIDVFRSRSKDKNQVLKKLQEEIGAHRKRLDSAQQMRLDGEIEPKEYQEIKIKYEKRISDIMREVANITNVDSDYQEYLDFGFHLIANIATYYAEADALAKQQLIGLICEEKIVFENYECRTIKYREVIENITRTSKELDENKNGTDKNFSYQSPVVHRRYEMYNQFIEDFELINDVMPFLKPK